MDLTTSAVKWATRAYIRATFALPHRTLNAYVTEGWVRSLKTADQMQARRLYYVPDVESCMAELSQGHTPRRAGGR